MNIEKVNGLMADLERVENIDNYDLMLITDSGVVMKMPLNQVSVLKRATQGLRLINLKDEQIVSSVAIVEKEEESGSESEVTEVVQIISEDSNSEKSDVR